MRHPLVHTALATSLLAIFSTPALGQTDVEARLKALESRLNALEAENQSLRDQLEGTDRPATTAEAEATADSAPTGAGSWAENTRVGGYGELHYNNLRGEGGASNKKEIDFHRFVLFFGHTFNERLRFFSELEIEHALVGEDAEGEAELEQAYVEFGLNPNHSAKAGLFLIPVGILNEIHEPPTFYGVERNPVETNIIPTTWWAGGAGLAGQLGGGFGYDFAVHEGLATTEDSGYRPRSGRQKTSEAKADDLAYTARLKWTGIPGVEIAGSFQHQPDITQGLDPAGGSAQLYTVHTILNRGPFGLRALYAQWDLDGSGPAAVGADEQFGWYVEPAFKLSEQWGVFARYNLWDNAAGDSAGSKNKQINVGVNWWVHPEVVLKADYQHQDNDNGGNQDGFNLGVGYMF